MCRQGEVQLQGTFKELLHSDVDYAQLLHLAEEDDEPEDGGEEGVPEDEKRPLMRVLRQLSRVSMRVGKSEKNN